MSWVHNAGKEIKPQAFTRGDAVHQKDSTLGRGLANPNIQYETNSEICLIACLYACPNPLCGLSVNQTTSNM